MQKETTVSRALQFLDEYDGKGLSLEEIGKNHGITRERVRQILSLVPEYFDAKKRKGENRRTVKNCLECGSEINYLVSQRAPVFCSRKCQGEHKANSLKDVTEKPCGRCGKTKPVSEFYPKYGRGKYAKATYCKKCQYAVSNDWRKRNPEKVRIISRRAVKKYLKNKMSTPGGIEFLRERSRRQWEKIKRDPIRYRAYLKKRAEYERKRYREAVAKKEWEDLGASSI